MGIRATRRESKHYLGAVVYQQKYLSFKRGPSVKKNLLPKLLGIFEAILFFNFTKIPHLDFECSKCPLIPPPTSGAGEQPGFGPRGVATPSAICAISILPFGRPPMGTLGASLDTKQGGDLPVSFSRYKSCHKSEGFFIWWLSAQIDFFETAGKTNQRESSINNSQAAHLSVKNSVRDTQIHRPFVRRRDHGLLTCECLLTNLCLVLNTKSHYCKD